MDPLLQDEPFPALILVDSGATTSAIDQKTVERYHLPTVKLPFPTKAINADGTENQSGYITQTCPINVQIGSFQFFWSFRVLELHDADLYLGFDWLHNYNPDIDWKSLALTLTQEEHLRQT